MAISRQSLWIDEALTALTAQQATLHDWWQLLFSTKSSDLQMPVYMFWMWVCGRIFGSSEIALRAVNLFWFVPGLIALLRVFAGRPQLQRAIFLTAIFSPFAWYYLDEVRPYAMQMGASLFLVATLCHWSQKPSPPVNESGWAWSFVIALVALSGSSLLAMIWAAVPLGAAIFLLPRTQLQELGRHHLFAWLTGLVLLAALGVYYLWTLKVGARATDVGTTDWKNVAFIAYELFGFAGLGPGRLEIRAEAGWQTFKPFAPGLALYAVLVLLLLVLGIRHLLQSDSRKIFWKLAGLITAPAVFILGAGVVLQFRVLGRHFAPLFPVTVLLLALGLMIAWQRGLLGKTVVAVFLGLIIFSSLSLRFAARHAKDDYRSAAAFANDALARGQSVWWNAADCGAIYYHVPLSTNQGGTKMAFELVNPTREFIASLASPDVIIASKPDIFDRRGALAEMVARRNFRETAVLPAFVVWEKTSRPDH